MEVCAGASDLYLNLPKLAIPFPLGRIISKQVVRAGIADTYIDCTPKIVVTKELPARVQSDPFHRIFLVEALVCFRFKSTVRLRTSDAGCLSPFRDVAQFAGHKASGVDRVNRDMSVTKQVRCFPHLIGVHARRIEVDGVES